MAEAEAVAAAAEAAEAAAAQVQAATVAAEAERAEAQAQAAGAAATPQVAVARPAVLSSAAGRAGPYAEAAQSLRVSTQSTAQAPAMGAGYLAGVPRDLQGQQQPQATLQRTGSALQRSGSALEVVVEKTYKGWAVIGVLMLGFILFLIIWSTA
eukprot:COSAG02_NODE_6221_length_3716_cov_1.907407_1_plen_154_part_00